MLSGVMYLNTSVVIRVECLAKVNETCLMNGESSTLKSSLPDPLLKNPRQATSPFVFPSNIAIIVLVHRSLLPVAIPSNCKMYSSY